MAHSNHLTSLDIEEQSDDNGDTSSLMHSSSSEPDSPLNHRTSNHSASKSSSASRANSNDHELQPAHSPYSPTPPFISSDIQSKPTNLPLLTACYMSALTTGATTYAFSFYSSALKTSLHLSQNQLDTLSSATFCAGILSWMPGMIVDAWGARRAMAIGGLSNTINLTLYWLIATETFNLHDLDLLILVLSALGVLIFVGCALVTGSVFKVIVESCGDGVKGKAVGCAKGYVGVGSGVYVCLFGALFGTSGSVVAGPEASSALSFINQIFSSMSIMPVGSPSYLATTESPQSPETSPLNFLLMAAALSFLAATLPALLLLPKQTSDSSASVYQNRRDGTRSIHFRVVYAGLFLLGCWVVGMSLMELHDAENSGTNNGGSSSAAVDPSILNKTLTNGDAMSFDDNRVGEYDDDESKSVSYARMLWSATRRLSYSTPEHHWGSVFFLLFLWWGPALSLLVIPPRKEGVDESIYSSSSGGDNERSAFNYEDDYESEDEDERIHNNRRETNEEETFLQDDLPTHNTGSRIKDGERSHLEAKEFTLLQMLRTCPAWLMAWTTVILVGGGTVMTNNIGQMTEALGFDSATTSSSLALFSAAQGSSRVCTGIASELALKWKLPWFCGRCFSTGDTSGVPRPAFLILASLVSATSHFLLAVSTSMEVFIIGVTLSGVAFGMVWPLMVLVVGEVWGTKHVGANYMFFDGFSSAVGTLLLSKFLAQEIYDEHINEESHGDGTNEENFQCIGLGCFAMSHTIVSLLSLSCIVSSVALMRSVRETYQR